MTCPTCKKPVPDKQLVCAACAEQKSRAAYMDLQRRYIDSILRDRLALTLAGQGTKQTDLHIVLIGDSNHTWCYEPIRTGGYKRQPRIYSEVDPKKLCQKCWQAFEEILLGPAVICQDSSD